ncbi:MAG TPA: hypothetical protein PLD88_00405, partial [Candidatus Berkiella sp.]|nr:hypothetical protein [Candidatus Berkiella sp.]
PQPQAFVSDIDHAQDDQTKQTIIADFNKKINAIAAVRAKQGIPTPQAPQGMPKETQFIDANAAYQHSLTIKLRGEGQV